MPFLPTERKQHHRAGTAGEVNKVRQYPRYCNFRGRKPSRRTDPAGKPQIMPTTGGYGTKKYAARSPERYEPDGQPDRREGGKRKASFRRPEKPPFLSGPFRKRRKNLPSEQRPDTEPTHRPEQAAGRVNPFRHGKKRQQPCTAHRCDVRPVLYHSFRHGPAKSDGRHHQIAVRRLEPPVPGSATWPTSSPMRSWAFRRA